MATRQVPGSSRIAEDSGEWDSAVEVDNSVLALRVAVQAIICVSECKLDQDTSTFIPPT